MDVVRKKIGLSRLGHRGQRPRERTTHTTGIADLTIVDHDVNVGSMNFIVPTVSVRSAVKPT
jgi:hypothetical protein